jgi:hypothetical protein
MLGNPPESCIHGVTIPRFQEIQGSLSIRLPAPVIHASLLEAQRNFAALHPTYTWQVDFMLVIMQVLTCMLLSISLLSDSVARSCEKFSY